MRTKQQIFGALGLLGLVAVMTACEQESLSLTSPAGEDGIHTVTMSFTGGVLDYEDVSTKAADLWQEGDRLYITFEAGGVLTPGKAVYQGGSWKMTYEGEIAVGTGMACRVRYFTGMGSETIGQVALDATSGVYEDLAGEYSYEGGVLNVNASLRPKFGRIRLKGTPGEACLLSGIETIGGFSAASEKYSTGAKVLTLTVGEDGYTPYVYGGFAGEEKAIGYIGKEVAYTRYFTEDVLAAGRSSYMACPTLDAHNNWRNGLYVTVEDVTFRMIGVTGHAGGYYLMGETELTNALYYRIKQDIAATRAQYPYNVSYDDAMDYLSRLNAQTGFTFSLPSYDQWLYAAKGGAYSLGRAYAGSDVALDVAWYNVNAGGAVKEVMLKSPNELGLYDMCGNYMEWTSTLGDESYAGSYRRAGGSYQDDLEGIKVNAYTFSKYQYTYYLPEATGMRLCLNVNL